MQPSNHEHFSAKNRTPTRPISSIENNNIIDAQLQEEPVFSSQKTRMDYVTLEGIENRTGIEKQNAYAFVIKELLDNAVDFLETEHIGISRKKDEKAMETIAAAEVQVHIIKEDDEFLRVIVVNSNQYGKSVFSKDMLQSIFNFETFYSSKRNQYKITRGALGDAFKEILCIPYALAREQQQGQQDSMEWNEPLIITTRVNGIQQTFLVYLVIDRINQTISSEIEVVAESKSEKQEESNFTRIEIRLPLIQHLLNLDKLKKFITGYVTFNTHIDFIFKIHSGSSDQTNKDDDNITLSFPQVQSINTKWSPISSIYYYSLSEFQNFILGLDNNDLQIYNVIQKSFREGSNMKKEPEFAAMTVGKLKQNTQFIKELYNKLRNTMKPLSIPSSLSLPFDSTKKARIKAITKRLEQQPSFKVSDIKYKSQYGYYKFKDGVEHPFFFEIAVVHSNNIVYYLDHVNSLNSSVIPGAYSFLTGSDSETFQWQTESDKKNNSIRVSESIFDIFEHYGYSFNKEKCKKPRSLIIANLISPRIDYKSYGKSIINLAPFADDIAEITVKACSGGGSGTTRLSERGNEETNSIIGFLRCLLKNRHDAVKQDPSLKDRQKWTQSTVFYHLRPILLDNGFSAETIDRQYITSEIKNVCENYLGVKREEIGITAADRAQLYFRRKWHDVGLDEIDNLVQYGTDMVIVEKEGVVKQLSPFADVKGIALLNTRGFLTEYASILSEQSRKNGCNIAILTDFDASGL